MQSHGRPVEGVQSAPQMIPVRTPARGSRGGLGMSSGWVILGPSLDKETPEPDVHAAHVRSERAASSTQGSAEEIHGLAAPKRALLRFADDGALGQRLHTLAALEHCALRGGISRAASQCQCQRGASPRLHRPSVHHQRGPSPDTEPLLQGLASRRSVRLGPLAVCPCAARPHSTRAVHPLFAARCKPPCGKLQYSDLALGVSPQAAEACCA
jgi:hypothetical protein